MLKLPLRMHFSDQNFVQVFVILVCISVSNCILKAIVCPGCVPDFVVSIVWVLILISSVMSVLRKDFCFL